MLPQTFVGQDIVYQKISNFLEKASERSPRFAARDWVEINDDRRLNYDNNLIEIKTSTIQSRLPDYISTYILVKGMVTAVGTGKVVWN